jgi:hypothetical protein
VVDDVPNRDEAVEEDIAVTIFAVVHYCRVRMYNCGSG